MDNLQSPLSQALIPYRTPPSSLSPTSRALIPTTRFFTAATGTAIATELLYRLLLEIVNRILYSVQGFAARRLEQLGSYLEQRALERGRRRGVMRESRGEGRGGEDKGFDAAGKRVGVVDEVRKLVRENDVAFGCPRGGEGREGKGPPLWVKGVLERVEEGRMLERDFWIHTHGD